MTKKVGAYPSRRGGVRRAPGRLSKQRGVIAVIGALCIAFAVVLVLGSIYLGMAYARRRQLQEEADLAALSAAQEINADPTCTGIAKSTAITSATGNGYALSNPTPVVQCGYWQASSTPGGTFSQTVPSGAQANAVSVTPSARVPYFGITDSVRAVAPNDVEDTFSLISALSPILTGVLDPVFALLDAIVTPLLQLLGLQVGQATVQNFPSAITCNPSLVR